MMSIEGKAGATSIFTAEKEWEAVRDAVKLFISSNPEKHPPFKLSRKDLEKLNHNAKEFFNHSVFVLPLNASDPGYQKEHHTPKQESERSEWLRSPR